MAESYLDKYLKKQKDEKMIISDDEYKINMINVEKLDSFEKHIFSRLSSFKFEELKDSIRNNGIVSPIIVRRKENDRFEIIAGHNRVQCAKELEMEEVPCIIKNVDNEQAELIMIDTNLAQRDEIIVSEKGFAYRKKLDILKEKKKNENPSLVSDSKVLEQGVHDEHLKSIDSLSNGKDDSRTTIQRLIRITYLIKELQVKVDNNTIPLLVGVHLSYIDNDKQGLINKVLEESNNIISVIQAEKLKNLNREITEEMILKVLQNKLKEKKNIFNGKIKKKIIKKYNDRFKNNDEFNDLIENLLEKHFTGIENVSDNVGQ